MHPQNNHRDETDDEVNVQLPIQLGNKTSSNLFYKQGTMHNFIYLVTIIFYIF